MLTVNPNPTTTISQRCHILADLQAGNELTSLTMLTKFGAIDGRKRISELRAQGFPIKSRKAYNESTKKYYNVYFLENNGEAGPV